MNGGLPPFAFLVDVCAGFGSGGKCEALDREDLDRDRDGVGVCQSD